MRQKEAETVDQFITQCRLQAQRCKFRDAKETEEHIIEQLIAGTANEDVKRELLGKDEKLTVDEAVKIAECHEAAIHHLSKLKESVNPPATHPHQVDVIRRQKQSERDKKCNKCGLHHQSKPKQQCPAYGTTCAICRKKNHWAKMCRLNKEEDFESQNSHHSHRNTQKYRGAKKSLHAVVQDEEESSDDEQFDEISFRMVEMSKSQEVRDEAVAKIKVQIPGNEKQPASLEVKVDTGAQGNILPLKIFSQMCPDKMASDGKPIAGMTRESKTVLSAYNGTKIPQLGTVKMKCRYKDNWEKQVFYVADTTGPAIMGLPGCQALGLVTLHCAVNVNMAGKTTEDLVRAYPEQFDRVGHFDGKYRIVVRPEAQPVIHAPRKCPIHLKDELKAEMDKMVKDKIIRKVDQPTEWVSSLTYSRKSSGQLRICLDPKDLNKVIKRCHHRTPTLEEITHELSGAKHFSKLDAKNGYWSVALDEESQLLTTFNSPFGRFCFQRMPFGLVMSQDMFQQKMDQILEQCPRTIDIADDVAVFGRTEEEHDQSLRNLMQVAAKSELVFNSKKCIIKAPQIHFFGMVYDADGAHPDPKRVEDIKALPPPSNEAELQQFLGIVTYMSPFIPHMSQHTAILRDLLKKEADFQWTANHEEAFQKVKKLIRKEATLAYFDPNKESVIQVDASSRGLGAALLQDGRPIAFASKSLTPTEQKYSNIEREMLAVVFGCKRFHTYVYAKGFTIESDHKPLEMIHKKNLGAAPPRLQRMLLETQGYEMQIKYRPGSEITLVDRLSRLPNTKQNKGINLDIKIQMVQFSDDKVTTIKTETRSDPVLSALLEAITVGWPEKRHKLSLPLRTYWGYRDELSVEDGIILKGGRTVIPTSMQKDILNKLHTPHMDMEKTKLPSKILCLLAKHQQ